VVDSTHGIFGHQFSLELVTNKINQQNHLPLGLLSKEDEYGFSEEAFKKLIACMPTGKAF